MVKIYEADGSKYKVGAHNLVYRWDNHEWVRSTKTVEEVLEQAKRYTRKNVNRTPESYEKANKYVRDRYVKKKEINNVSVNKKSR